MTIVSLGVLLDHETQARNRGGQPGNCPHIIFKSMFNCYVQQEVTIIPPSPKIVQQQVVIILPSLPNISGGCGFDETISL